MLYGWSPSKICQIYLKSIIRKRGTVKKGIVIGLGILFIVAILFSGCGKSDEKKAEAPSVQKQAVKQKAAAVKTERGEKAYPVSNSGSGQVEQAVTETVPQYTDPYVEKSFEEKAAEKGMKPLTKY
jgi:hypothetical protein